MKALMKLHNAPGLDMQNVPVPKIGDNEVLIKTKKTSICGTDIHIYKWDAWAQKTVPYPMIIGHEFVGEIAEVGKNVKHLKIGQRVTGEGHITCGVCPNCRKGNKHLCSDVFGLGYDCSGCFAEYFNFPAENVVVLPDTIRDDLAAIMDPFGNATHAALSFDLVCEDVLITGAGPIGIMSAAIAKHAGARNIVITDLNDYRLDLAKQMGATCTVNVGRESLKEKMKEVGIEHGFTIGLEMSGFPKGLNELINNMMHGGKVSLLGLLPPGTSIDWDIVIFRMLLIKGIYGREIFDTWYKMINMLESGLNIDKIITHQFNVDDFQKGFDVMMSGNSGKVILNWS